MKPQRGQSMTEYLVVLGVTGAALLLAGNDVERLFDNVRSSYKSYSSEMNKVQLYNNEAVRFLDPSPMTASMTASLSHRRRPSRNSLRTTNSQHWTRCMTPTAFMWGAWKIKS